MAVDNFPSLARGIEALGDEIEGLGKLPFLLGGEIKATVTLVSCRFYAFEPKSKFHHIYQYHSTRSLNGVNKSKTIRRFRKKQRKS